MRRGRQRSFQAGGAENESVRVDSDRRDRVIHIDRAEAGTTRYPGSIGADDAARCQRAISKTVRCSRKSQ